MILRFMKPLAPNVLCTELLVVQTLCSPRAGPGGTVSCSELGLGTAWDMVYTAMPFTCHTVLALLSLHWMGTAKCSCSLMSFCPQSGESDFSSQLHPGIEKNANTPFHQAVPCLLPSNCNPTGSATKEQKDGKK